MNHTKTTDHNLKYDVLVEKSGENGYTARVLAWPDCVVQAATREEAVALVRATILERLAKADIVTLEFTPEQISHPWLKFAGMWADDPDFDEFLAEIERYRREVDAKWAPWLLEPEEETETHPPEEAVVA